MSRPGRIHIEHHRVRAGRTEWHVAKAGEGPPLLLLHGWPEFWAVWEKQIERLAPRWTCYAPDLPGFGESSDPNAGRPAENVGPAELTADVVGLLDALGLERVGLVTHDVGAYVAQVMGRTHPARLAGIFLFDCPNPLVGKRLVEPDYLKETWYQYFNRLPFSAALVGSSREACALYIGGMLRHWSAREDAFGDADIARWVDAYMRPGNLQAGFNWYRSVAAQRLVAMKGETPAQPRIAVPARCWWGRRGAVLPGEWADTVKDLFEHVEVDLCEAGHFPHWEIPDAAAAEIERFFTPLFHP